jgi:murein DD-endopeptidase MepM/ murein hydrolase activator NlpD
VVATKFSASMQLVFSALVAVPAMLASAPAFASSNAADIAAPLRAAQEARPTAAGNADADFRRLFADWRSMDKGSGYVAPQTGSALSGPGALVPVMGAPASTSFARAGRVSIPSRMPVEGVRLTSDYGLRYHPVLGGRRAHKGVDLAGAVGTPVYASADAVVSKAEWFSSYGLYVSLEHGADIQTRYGHMSRLNVYAGQQVRKGDVIGYIGTTGRSTGPHLHYEVRIAGVAVNPIPYMQADMMAAPAAPAPASDLDSSGLVAVATSR